MTEKATFAGGCFWCMEPPFRRLPGVQGVTSGYTGGKTVNPDYESVSSGDTGHVEAVLIEFDPQKISYERLLETFWKNIDPTAKDRQFCDVGTQYRTAIFVHSAQQRAAAERSRTAWLADPRFRDRAIQTVIEQAGPFYRAEEYHQDYARKNPLRYEQYRQACQRDQKLKEIWGQAPH